MTNDEMQNVKITSDSYDAQLLCPECGSEFTHLINVEVYNSRSDEARMSVVLTFRCEDGHIFKLDIHQHEGTTYLRNADKQIDC